MNIKILLMMSVFFTSCQVYKSDFDCPPCKGVLCRSVSEIESMIIETPEGGSDLFFEIPKQDCFVSNNSRKRSKNGIVTGQRIWIENSECNHSSVEGHYIYIKKDCDLENVQ